MSKTFFMQHLMLVLAILLLTAIIPGRYSESENEKVTMLMHIQKAPEKEVCTAPADDEADTDTDFCIYGAVIDISGF